MDAKISPNQNGNSEDFSWNAVWKSAAKIHADGWSFEMFIPFSAIRFSKKNVQDWGFNIMRRRQKTGQQVFWNTLDPNVNGFLTQGWSMDRFGKYQTAVTFTILSVLFYLRQSQSI